LLLTDTRYVTTERKVDAKQIELPMYHHVMEKLGNPVVLNICMLGALISLWSIVKPESIMKILEKRLPANLIQMNRNALELGISLGDNAK